MRFYKGVIFDFNGTLFFDNPKHILAWSKISQDIRNHGISEEELHKHINGVPNHKVVAYMFHGQCTEEQMKKYSELKEEYYRQFCKEDKDSFHLVKGAEAYFDALKKIIFLLRLLLHRLSKTLISLWNHFILIAGWILLLLCMMTVHMKIK